MRGNIQRRDIENVLKCSSYSNSFILRVIREVYGRKERPVIACPFQLNVGEECQKDIGEKMLVGVIQSKEEEDMDVLSFLLSIPSLKEKIFDGIMGVIREAKQKESVIF